jgi:hypothetical protein
MAKDDNKLTNPPQLPSRPSSSLEISPDPPKLPAKGEVGPSNILTLAPLFPSSQNETPIPPNSEPRPWDSPVPPTHSRSSTIYSRQPPSVSLSHIVRVDDVSTQHQNQSHNAQASDQNSTNEGRPVVLDVLGRTVGQNQNGGKQSIIQLPSNKGVISLPPMYKMPQEDNLSPIQRLFGRNTIKVAVQPREFVMGKGIEHQNAQKVASSTHHSNNNENVHHHHIHHHHHHHHIHLHNQKPPAPKPIVPHLLDTNLLLHKAPAQDPSDVYIADISSTDLWYVIPEDLIHFVSLHTLKAGDNKLPFARLGGLPRLQRLYMPFNQVADLDLDVEGKFTSLEVCSNPPFFFLHSKCCVFLGL